MSRDKARAHVTIYHPGTDQASRLQSFFAFARAQGEEAHPLRVVTLPALRVTMREPPDGVDLPLLCDVCRSTPVSTLQQEGDYCARRGGERSLTPAGYPSPGACTGKMQRPWPTPKTVPIPGAVLQEGRLQGSGEAEIGALPEDKYIGSQLGDYPWKCTACRGVSFYELKGARAHVRTAHGDLMPDAAVCDACGHREHAANDGTTCGVQRPRQLPCRGTLRSPRGPQAVAGEVPAGRNPWAGQGRDVELNGLRSEHDALRKMLADAGHVGADAEALTGPLRRLLLSTDAAGAKRDADRLRVLSMACAILAERLRYAEAIIGAGTSTTPGPATRIWTNRPKRWGTCRDCTTEGEVAELTGYCQACEGKAVGEVSDG